MKRITCNILIATGCFLILTVVFIFADLQIKEWVLPRQAEIERETWENSQSYRKGLLQDLRKHRREYLRLKSKRQALSSDHPRYRTIGQQMDMIAASVRQRSSQVDPNDLSDYPQVQAFVRKMRQRSQ
jgi:hypothetical protein